MVGMNDADIMKSFKQGIAAALSDEEVTPDEVYDNALRFACNDFNLRADWLDARLAIHFDVNGWPSSWAAYIGWS
jgi:hypothetical protein